MISNNLNIILDWNPVEVFKYSSHMLMIVFSGKRISKRAVEF